MVGARNPTCSARGGRSPPKRRSIPTQGLGQNPCVEVLDDVGRNSDGVVFWLRLDHLALTRRVRWFFPRSV